MTCAKCGGNGTIVVDCPFCRGTDSFEHDNLRPGKCLACHGSGALEEICPECGGKKAYAAPVRKVS